MKRFVFIIALAAFTLLTLEGIVRLADPLGASYFGEIDRYFKDIRKDPLLWYRHRPSTTSLYAGVTYRFNANGFRGPEVALEKDSSRKRVLFLGDSFVLGWGVEESMVFTHGVSRLLAEEGRPIEQIDAGVCSWNTRNEFEFLKTEGLAMRPDAVVLFVTRNDIMPKPGGPSGVNREQLTEAFRAWDNAPAGLAGKSWKRLCEYSALLTCIQAVRIRQFPSAKSAYNTITDNSIEWLDASDAIEGIAGLCHSNEVALIPVLHITEKNSEKDPVLSRFARQFERCGYPPLFLPRELFKEPGMVISYSDPHPTPHGHAVIAKTIAPALKGALADGPQGQPSLAR